MAHSRADIEQKVTEVLESALGSDAEDITPAATLTEDLGAESIDFLDIQFQLEKKFSTPEKPFKIEQGELFPENMMSNPDYVKDGKFTDAGMAVLKEKMPHVDLSVFTGDRNVKGLAKIFTVKSLCDFIEIKLKKG
ncbi:MAG: acyl carrier protein [Phycisphaerae bacterium]|nr:acyl carrier protein [Phycisphaerae bacterium]